MMTLLYILLPIILSFLINLFTFRKERTNDLQSRDIQYLPPGPIIGIVWTILLGLLGYTYSLLENNNKNMNLQKISIILLTLFCLLYPILTANSTIRFSKNYNYLTLIFVLTVFYTIFKNSKKIAYYLIPLLFWIIYVNIITLLDDIQLIDVF
jgi:tryptophan-rich sensory protein